MSDRASEQLSDPDTGEQPAPPARRRAQSLPLRFGAIVLASYAVVGAALGWLWHALWTPHDGEVFNHQWYAAGDALRADFSGTGLYFLVGAGGGLVLGLVVSALGARHPLATLVVATVGAVLAGWVMLVVGQALGPPDPAAAAKTAKDGAMLPAALRVTGLSPHLAVPMGTLAGVAVVFMIFPGNRRKQP